MTIINKMLYGAFQSASLPQFIFLSRLVILQPIPNRTALMLKHLYIRNFTIIDEIERDVAEGLTVLTGETGAGKSILIDALQVVLGERAESGLIKVGQERCEITAIFAVDDNLPARQWLEQQAMDEGQECLLRRIINSDGRSRSSINGRPCSLQSVRELGALLVHIHGQNQHQQLLKSHYQRELLDEFAQHTALVAAVNHTHQQWRAATQALASIQADDQSARQALLDFQIQELQELDLRADELSVLEVEHKRLAHAEQSISRCQQALDVLAQSEQTSVLQGLYAVDALLKHVPSENPSTLELLQQATIQIQEVVVQVRHTLDTLEPDPNRLQWIEQRLARIHDLARKHRIEPEALPALQQDLETQRQALDHSAERVAALQQEIEKLTQHYLQQADDLTRSRQKAAEVLSTAVTAQIQGLGMPGGRLHIVLTPKEGKELHAHGAEHIEFLVSTNPGQPLAPLKAVVSGGELSRIALAIQVVAAAAAILPTLIFDEVDVGIGGGTAEIVGQKLRALGERAQVLCVTHLPQVAAQGNHHWLIEKRTDQQVVHTGIRLLSTQERVQEVARMLGGVKITEKTLAHAREMVG